MNVQEAVKKTLDIYGDSDEYQSIDNAMDYLLQLMNVDDEQRIKKAVYEAPHAIILDACCGGRMFWWNKENEHVYFADKREVNKGAFKNNWNPNWCIKPDGVHDFRNMPYDDNTFKMVVFDPPHLTSGSEKSVINMKYGLLNKETWKADIVAGFSECWRVLDDYGVMIFKWNEANIKAKELLREFPVEPLFGDFTGKTGKTIWITFIKLPEKEKNYD